MWLLSILSTSVYLSLSLWVNKIALCCFRSLLKSHLFLLLLEASSVVLFQKIKWIRLCDTHTFTHTNTCTRTHTHWYCLHFFKDTNVPEEREGSTNFWQTWHSWANIDTTLRHGPRLPERCGGLDLIKEQESATSDCHLIGPYLPLQRPLQRAEVLGSDLPLLVRHWVASQARVCQQTARGPPYFLINTESRAARAPQYIRALGEEFWNFSRGCLFSVSHGERATSQLG